MIKPKYLSETNDATDPKDVLELKDATTTKDTTERTIKMQLKCDMLWNLK